MLSWNLYFIFLEQYWLSEYFFYMKFLNSHDLIVHIFPMSYLQSIDATQIFVSSLFYWIADIILAFANHLSNTQICFYASMGGPGFQENCFQKIFFTSSGLYFSANKRKNWRETVVLRIRNWEFSGSDSHKRKFPFVFYTFRNPYLKAKIVILRWSARDQQNSTVGIFVLGKKTTKPHQLFVNKNRAHISDKENIWRLLQTIVRNFTLENWVFIFPSYAALTLDKYVGTFSWRYMWICFLYFP